MKEELISFETAVLAKEKGFNNKNTYMFYGNVLHINSFELCAHKFADKILMEGIPGTFVDYNQKELVSYQAPTQTLLQKWLREKYGLHIVVDIPWIGNGWLCTIYDIRSDSKELASINKYKKYNTYEAILEAGLFQALKLI